MTRVLYAHTSKEAKMSIQNASIEDFEEEVVENDEIKENLEEIGEEIVEEHKDEFDSEDEEYGAKVRKRIGKEVSKRKIIEHERDGFKDEVNIYKTEADNARKELAEFRKNQFESDRKRLTEEIELDKKAAASALEDAETEKYLQLNERMTDNKVRLSRNEQAEEMHNYQEAQRPQEKESGRTAAADNWLNNNKGWIKSDPSKFKRAQRLSNQLESEGYDVSDMSLYEEMDNRLNQTQERQPETVHVPNGDLPAKQAKKDGLTNDDKRNMKTFGLDPLDATDRKNWLDGKKGVL